MSNFYFYYIASASDCLLLKADLDNFCEWAQKLNFTLNTEKCYLMSFSRNNCSPISHSYSFINIPVNRVTLIKNLGSYFSHTLFFVHYINHTIIKALKFLNSIKCTPKIFLSFPAFVPFTSPWFVSSWNMTYEVIVLNPYLARDNYPSG